MEHERPHLDRSKGDIEVGYANALRDEQRHEKHAGPEPELPAWLVTWESRKPIWFKELFAEFMGVMFYVIPGMGATASFLVTSAAKTAGFGDVFNIGLSYAFGIIFALILSAPLSGGHLHPGFTITFSLLKGFPARKVVPYILAQIFGGFISSLIVYCMYKPSLDAVHDALVAAGAGAEVFTAAGPAGVLALFPTVSPLRWTFGVEFFCCFVLAVVVFCVIDPRNPLVSPTIGPFIIGGAYMTMIIAFASQAVSLNPARDVGGRLACSAIYGVQCWNAFPTYSALAALTNIPATILGGLVHTLLIADHTREVLHSAVTAPPPGESNSGDIRVISREQGEKK